MFSRRPLYITPYGGKYGCFGYTYLESFGTLVWCGSMTKHAYYASLEIVQEGKCYRCDLPYKSLSQEFERGEVIDHFYSIFSHPVNSGVINRYGMSAYDFSVDIFDNEKDSVENYDLSWLFSVDCWKSISQPRAYPYQHRLNLLGLLSKHVEYRSERSGLEESC